jgi:hypothetical protein
VSTSPAIVLPGEFQPKTGTMDAWNAAYVRVEDYLRAFRSPPGRLVGVGIMTDTDNTGERIEAFYGDIELKRAR